MLQLVLLLVVLLLLLLLLVLLLVLLVLLLLLLSLLLPLGCSPLGLRPAFTACRKLSWLSTTLPSKVSATLDTR